MAGSKLSSRVQSSDAYVSWGGRLWGVAKYLGIDSYVNAAIAVSVTAMMGIIVWLYNNLPWWSYIPVALFTGTYAAKAFTAVRQAFAITGIRKFDLTEYANSCVSYHKEYMNFIRTETLRNASAKRAQIITADTALTAHAEMVRESNEMRLAKCQRFAAQALSIVHQLGVLNIPKPSLFSFEHSMDQISVYIGVVGELLLAGDLDSARKLNPQDYWGVHYG